MPTEKQADPTVIPVTGNLHLSEFMVHGVAIIGAAIVFLSADEKFMLMFPEWVSTTTHAIVPFLTYLGISQVRSVKKDA